MIVFQTRVTWAADEPLPFGRGETGPGCRRRSFDERQVVYRCCAAMGFQTGFYRFPVRRSAPPRSSPATAQNAAGVPQNTAGMLLLTAVILLEPHGAGTKYTAIAIHGDEEGANSTRTWASTTIGGQEVSRPTAASPSGSQSRSAGFVERKGAMYPLSLSVNPVDGLRKSDNDPNCALSDCRVGLDPLSLYQPL